MGSLLPLCCLSLAGSLVHGSPGLAKASGSADGRPVQEFVRPHSGGSEQPPSSDASAPESESESESESVSTDRASNRAQTRAARWRARWAAGPATRPASRRWMIAVEGLIAQAPPLRPTIIRLDPRALGRNVALGGVGAFGRYRPVPLIGVELGVRSSSLRYSDGDDDTVISQDHVFVDAGVLLYLARGEIAQFAFDAGLGGSWARIAYEPASGEDGTHIIASGLVRVGADAEFVVKRVVFVLSLRMFGLFTDPSRAKARGAIFEGTRASVRRAPVPAAQTWLVASGGIGYRF